MGWWSEDIMGGDTPCDIECEILKICGLQKFEDCEDPDVIVENFITYDLFERHIDKICRHLTLMGKKHKEDNIIGFQVLGYLMMKAGAEIKLNLKDLIINKAKEDFWAKNDSVRKKIMDEFILDLESYDGTPKERHQHGLFEMLSKSLPSSGLINKNIS